ncbi:MULTISPECIES: carbamoyltransferase HypF [unclassified Streptomyces]|uniref:carbamoyltransferase HypF n=1 Tax=unclassified Streptomyces TaxID=2593676 RepID=UPI00278BAFE5|nr:MULTISPECIES: carbamoyltransferase HypF [unclassified Streptomyces]
MSATDRAPQSCQTCQTWRIAVFGRVQGVGFRPFVHRTAGALGVAGWVRNVDGHVEITARAPARALDRLVARIRDEAPPLAMVRTVEVTHADDQLAAAEGTFTVRPSPHAPTVTGRREIPPDAATCDPCLAELFDPADRRFRYPFLSCSDCGPRATVIEALPYDRARTTMRRFPLCAACAAEYTDPADRRFHAEPLACPDCGPRLAWAGAGRPDQPGPSGDIALKAAVRAVDDGGIVALKGLGGYQLVCDASRLTAVAELRRRKHRPAKPFAVMVADPAAVRRLAECGAVEEAALRSPQRPIVVLDVGSHIPLPQVSPGTGRLGLFLPTTGLHHLLLRALDRPLVVTSGNRSGGPIAIDDAAARRTLAGIADGFLTHDRPVAARYDDSVVHRVGRRVRTVRRARGLAPAPLGLPLASPLPLVAAGAHLKHTFTLVEGDRAHIAAHTGDLADADTYDAFRSSYADLTRLTGIAPRAVAHDMHPGYLSTQWAQGLPDGVRRVPVQHHHAHVAAVAAEHGVRTPFIGVAYDGLGLGDDGTLWGGEVLVASLTGYRRVGRFARAPLPGGESAVRHPWRTALGHLYGAEPLGSQPPPAWLARTFARRLDAVAAERVCALIRRGTHCPQASSAGRLFDTVAALLGLSEDTVSYEGEAAVALESAADRAPGKVPALPWRIARADGVWVYDPAPTLTAVLERRAEGEPAPVLAAAFHATVAEATAALVERVVADGGPRTVCLGGGCFVNRRLLQGTSRLLRAQGLRVLAGSAVPANDGGISFGQAAVAAARLRADEGRT